MTTEISVMYGSEKVNDAAKNELSMRSSMWNGGDPNKLIIDLIIGGQV